MKTRIVSIDYGLVRIGIAISDEMKVIASPYKTVQAKKQLKETVKAVLTELQAHCQENGYIIEEIVVGLPLKMNGQMGLQADEVMHFVELMRQETSEPIVTWDERLTSVQAERAMREGGMSRKKRSRSVDRIAAVIILQSYLDQKSSSPRF